MIESDYRGLQFDQEDLRNHRDFFVFRVKFDFSNVHVYHTDAYIPRKRCLFNSSSVKESVDTYCCEGWHGAPKVDDAGMFE